MTPPVVCACVCRIPHVNLLGYDAASGDMLLYNFWKDSKVIINANIIVWTFTNARLCLDISIVSNINTLFISVHCFVQNPKGLWRKTTLDSYQSPTTEWTTVLDLDELARKEEVRRHIHVA